MHEFLEWEASTRDVLDFKKIYVEMAGDLMAGLMLSELVYWYLPSKAGRTRLRVRRGGRQWVASRRYEWWDRCRLTPKQADRAAQILVKRGLLDRAVFRFGGMPTAHFSLNEAAFLAAWKRALEHPAPNPFLPKGRSRSTPGAETNSPAGENLFPQEVNSLTETTTENTTEITEEDGASSATHSDSWANSNAALVVSTDETPATPREAMLHPDIQAYHAVCGRWPGRPDYRIVIDTVRFLRVRYGEGLHDFLTPYWLAWSGRRRRSDGRPYDPRSVTWLAEWAINGTIPAAGESEAPVESVGLTVARRWLRKQKGVTNGGT